MKGTSPRAARTPREMVASAPLGFFYCAAPTIHEVLSCASFLCVRVALFIEFLVQQSLIFDEKNMSSGNAEKPLRDTT